MYALGEVVLKGGCCVFFKASQLPHFVEINMQYGYVLTMTEINDYLFVAAIKADR